MGIHPNHLGLIGLELLLVGVVVMAAIAIVLNSFFLSSKSQTASQQQNSLHHQEPSVTPTATIVSNQSDDEAKLREFIEETLNSRLPSGPCKFYRKNIVVFTQKI